MKKVMIIAGSLVFLFLCVFAQTSPATGGKASIERGRKVYEQYCLTCHQADGSGVPSMNPPLIKTSYVGGDITKLARIVLNGFNEGVMINGDEYTNPMPPFGSTLKDQEIADVLTYVRKSFGNNAQAVSPVFVKKERSENKQ
jgi:mono/diheme cytochrome c family protein